MKKPKADKPETKKPAKKGRPPKIAPATGRSVTEWIGKTPDSMPPPRVRLRIFDRAGGLCYLSGRKIRPADAWELEHVVALADGGENRESNLRPALKAPHKEKSKREASERAAARAKRAKLIGIKREPKQKIESRNDLAKAKAPRIEKATPPRRGGLYARYFGGE